MEDSHPKLEPTVVEGSASEETLVNDGPISQSSMSLCEQNIVTSTEDGDNQKQSLEVVTQSSSHSVTKKRRLSGNEDSLFKKIKIESESIGKQYAFVKLSRMPAIEQLLVEYQEKKHSKNAEEMWGGWKAPNPILRETMKNLQRIINDTDQLCRGALASRKWQARGDQSTKPKFLNVCKKSNKVSETVVNIDSNLEKVDTFDKCIREETMKDPGGLCGFDLDILSGDCRGFPKPSTKSRDELNQKIKLLERNLSLMTMLEEADQAVSSCFKAEQNDHDCTNMVTLEEAKEENSVNMRINQHLKDLLKFVAGINSKEPPFSYMVLVTMALKSSQESSVPLENILQYIQGQFPYYLTASSSWKNSVYQTIHWSDTFVKTCTTSSCNAKTSTDHGGCWTVDPLTAEGILGRAVDAQNRRAKGTLRFDKNTSKPPQSTNEKYNHPRKNICKPIELHQPIKTSNNVFEDITEKLNVSKIKRRKNKGREIKNEDVHDSIHLILKAAENLESQTMATFSEFERKSDKVKEIVEKNKDVDDKINQHIKDLLGFVATNPLMEPPFSYMVLAVMALKSSPQPSLPLNDIFQFIKDKFPFYRSGNESWMNAVKRTITWSNMFVKTCLSSCPGKKSQEHGGCWSVVSVTAEEILARAAEVHNRKGKENNLDVVSNDQNIVNEAKNPVKNENSEVSIDNEKCSKDKNSHLLKHEELASQTLDVEHVHTNFVKPDILSLKDSDSESAASDSNEVVLQSKEHTLDTGFSYYLNDKNMCHQSHRFATRELEQSCNDNVTFYCRDCNNLFICVFYLKHHQCSGGDSNPGYPCYLCHTNFTDVDKFCIHLVTDHNGMINKHDPSPLCWTIKNNCNFRSSQNHSKCQLCPAAFPNPELLEAHVKFVHN